MNTLVISKKKYVLLEISVYEKLQIAAARKTKPMKKLSLSEGKKHTYKLIDKYSASVSKK